MGTTFKPLYASDVALTMTSLASLGNGSAAGSAAADNTTNLYEDALVSVVIKTGGAGTLTNGTCSIYAYGETDGTHYSDNVTGTDAAQTLTSPPNLSAPLKILNTVAVSTTYYSGPFSVARAFGGILPQKWGIVVVNNSGGALAASGSSADYQGVNVQIP